MILKGFLKVLRELSRFKWSLAFILWCIIVYFLFCVYYHEIYIIDWQKGNFDDYLVFGPYIGFIIVIFMYVNDLFRKNENNKKQ